MFGIKALTPRRAAIGMPLLLVATGGIVAAGMTAATAAEPSVVTEDGAGRITVTAAAGVNNIMTLTPSGTSIDLTESTAELTVQSGQRCTAISTHLVRCSNTTNFTANLGDGNDTFTNSTAITKVRANGQAGADTFNGGPGADWFYGGNQDDVIHGGSGNDRLFGDAGADKVFGDNGNDDVLGGVDKDKVNGGAGDDNVRGGAGDDIVHGDSNNDTLWVDEGSDDLYGDDGDDTFRSYPASGYKDLFGGTGTDTVDYADWTADVTVSLDGTSNDGHRGSADCDDLFGCPVVSVKENVHSDVEDVKGSPKNDKIIGNNYDNKLYGLGGNDVVHGKGGNDTVDAGVGTDQKVDGGTEYDICRGDGVPSWPGCDS